MYLCKWSLYICKWIVNQFEVENFSHAEVLFKHLSISDWILSCCMRWYCGISPSNVKLIYDTWLLYIGLNASKHFISHISRILLATFQNSSNKKSDQTTYQIKDINDDKNRFYIIMLLFAWSFAVEHRETWYFSLAAKVYRINPRRCKVITHGVWREKLFWRGGLLFLYLTLFCRKLRTFG